MPTATIGNDGTLRIRDLPDGKEPVALRGHGASGEQAAFLPTAPGHESTTRGIRSLTAEERGTYLGETS